ncbi:MAG: bifunctional 5,10-methylenetetrahydrofolate dehydrogenase/5,10-methenyltetrahydrofolate cyclohydrolase [Oscillospiraceae bacterium]
MAEILKGAPVAAALNEKTAKLVSQLREKGVIPTLAMVRVGANDADIFYERGTMKRCDSVGVEVKNIIFPEDVSEAELLGTIDMLNRDGSVHGVLIFRPLPKHISDDKVRAALLPDKDVDGITDGSLAGVFTGSGQGFCPCTAEACTELLDHYGIELTGKRAAVLGRSLVIGKPVSQLLLGKNATVTVCHTRTQSLSEETRRADIIIAAAGRAGVLTNDHVSPGQIIIDVGINSDADGKMCGDVDFKSVEPVVGAITPVPGGVGSVTTSVLVSHVAKAALRAAQ